MALRAVRERKPVFILGDLVHNKDVVRAFRNLGVRRVNSLRRLPRGATLIITAHGVSPGLIGRAEKMGLRLVDTTCPWVKKAQRLARMLSESGRQVVIVGDRGHPEVMGLVAWAGGRARIVPDAGALKTLKLGKKVGVIAQTTQSKDNFAGVVRELRKRVGDLSVHNTICGATSKRQCSASDLSGRADLMLVVGDLKSANTKRLAQICRAAGAQTRQIQNDRELRTSWLKGKKRVGLTAGASTPDWVIDKVLKKVRRHSASS